MELRKAEQETEGGGDVIADHSSVSHGEGRGFDGTAITGDFPRGGTLS